jgi:hypothetical protein
MGLPRKKMERRQYNLDIHFKGEVMTPDEVAKFFKKSTSWVYKNWKILGGAKLGGSLFFPNKEELYDLLFQKKKAVEVRHYSQGNHVQRDQSENKKKGVAEKFTIGGEDANRHGLF